MCAQYEKKIFLPHIGGMEHAFILSSMDSAVSKTHVSWQGSPSASRYIRRHVAFSSRNSKDSWIALCLKERRLEITTKS